MFVTVEGIEASGKSTLIASLAARFGSAGQPLVVTREPGGTPLGDRLRSVFLDPGLTIDPMSETFLLNASRAALVREVIRPALAEGKAVLCDRFTDATLAYQGFGRGLDIEMLRAMCNAATGGLTPDRTLLLDLPLELAFDRLRARERGAGDRVERERMEFHRRVHEGYRALARSDPRFVVLDAAQGPEAVAASAWAALQRGAAR